MKIKFLFFLVICTHSVWGQDNPDDYLIKDTLNFDYELFSSEEPLKIVLKSDFRKLRKEKSRNKYQDAELIYFLSDSTEVSHAIKIRARGKYRLETCRFPPIQINLKKTAKNGAKFRFYKLKMVVHCKESELYENYILKEYLCYKLYRVFTDTSFRVRLLNVTYQDTGHKKPKEVQMFAFLIEDKKMLFERLDAIPEKRNNLSQTAVNEQNIIRLALFQFMIGNVDWGVPKQHNIRLIRPKSALNKLFAVPYDFDFCGMVNPVYAVLNPELGIKSLKQRLFLGQCKTEELFIPAFKEFINKKEAFYQVIESFKYLHKSHKKNMLSYLNEFYKMLENKNFYKSRILSNCKRL